MPQFMCGNIKRNNRMKCYIISVAKAHHMTSAIPLGIIGPISIIWNKKMNITGDIHPRIIDTVPLAYGGPIIHNVLYPPVHIKGWLILVECCPISWSIVGGIIVELNGIGIIASPLNV